tara:strand:+ start:13613 stop:14068 length:456 start_codon:yes stop_codon:yes gene_type:complete
MNAPQFTLENQAHQKISLADYKGKWLILYFYPRDNTPGCTIEAVDFTAKKEEFHKLNAEIAGVSKDSVESHQKFCLKRDLTITLLSDPSTEMMQSYNVWGMKKFMGREFMGTIRSTFIINPLGEIVHKWSPVKAKGHVEEVYTKLKELHNT